MNEQTIPAGKSWLMAAIAIIAIVGVSILVTLQPWRKSQTTVTKYCPDTSTAENVAAAGMVMTGTVFAVLPDPLGAAVIVTPSQVYRGRLTTSTVKVIAKPNKPMTAHQAASADLVLTTNDGPYLFFLKRRPDGFFTTSRCFGTRLLGLGLTADEAAALAVPVSQ